MDSTTGTVILHCRDAESLKTSKQKTFTVQSAHNRKELYPAILQALRALIFFHKPYLTEN